MPICNKPLTAGNKSVAEIDDHASEAAKVKRTREQAYFNSYDFDAIEVLPYDEDDDDEDTNHPHHKLPSKVSQTQQQHAQVATHSGTAPTIFARTVSKQPAQLSPNSRRRLQHASLSSKSNSTTPSSASASSRGSCGSYSQPLHHSSDIKYAYLQRLGAFFVASSSHGSEPLERSSSKQTVESTTQPPPPLDMIMGAGRSGDIVADAENGNFLLPRAMLKHQSVGSSNSMPLAVNSATTTTTSHTGAGKLLPNGGSDAGHNNKATMMMTTNKNANNSHGSASTLSPSIKTTTRLNYANGGVGGGSVDGNTGFLITADNVSATQLTTTRNKKQSTSSTITTTSASVASGDLQQQHDAVNDVVIGRNTISAKATTATATPASNESEQRGRPSSHKSHYSTDKSGSSGYYSSNVCSTYSIEDHIYCEPVIDILDLTANSKSVAVASSCDRGKVVEAANTAASILQHHTRQRQLQSNDNATTVLGQSSSAKVEHNATLTSSRTRDMNGVGQSKRRIEDCADEAEQDDDDDDGGDRSKGKSKRMSHTLRRQVDHLAEEQPFSENLRILETSIENLDRHLKNFSSLSSQERIASFVQSHHTYLQQGSEVVEKVRPYPHLPTIMEGYDPLNKTPRPWQDDMVDDSLMDIDLDSFLLVNETKNSKRSSNSKTIAKPMSASTGGGGGGGIDNPSFHLTDELEENNYKCAKYINSCPEDAYRVDSDIVAGTASNSDKSSAATTVDNFVKRYEDQLHFQNTRELLEDVRDKIRLLSQANSELRSSSSSNSQVQVEVVDEMPKELDGMIKTLKCELESYLNRMNQHSELEIRQLCSGLVKNQNIVKMKKAFERRRSTATSLSAFDSECDFSAYEAIRCASDPNFKMKRKSLTEIFPVAGCYIESGNENTRRTSLGRGGEPLEIAVVVPQTQLQRNLSFHKPILNQLDSKVGPSGIGPVGGGGGAGGSGGESGESGDKDSLAEWHRKKPSIWEMYYGTNRMNQSLLGKRNGIVVNSNQATMSYPSSRPESDFTLDLPRAEQLRIKMEKEKKFRQRCRYITTFLSLVFFLLTVMVVSLVLTRGKRMFGSMI